MSLDVSSLVPIFGELGARADRLAGRTDPSRRNSTEGNGMSEHHEIVESNKVWYLQQNRLFAQASMESIENCEHLFKTTLFPKKALVFDQGDPTRLVYLIKRGKVRIARLTPDGKEVTVAVLGEGDLFGEETLFEKRERTTIASCMVESLLCTAKADDLFGLLSQNPTLALNVASVLSDRLGEASATMEDLAYAKVPDRIVNLFARLAEEHGVPAGDGDIRIEVRLTHADVASLVGSTRETVSLEMAALLRSKRLTYDGKFYTLPASEAALS
jgi:CRP/FNR family transcriptional regulator